MRPPVRFEDKAVLDAAIIANARAVE